ncbi:MAG: divalent metal cation transporter, partial [Deltaproteobacteria bacterium]|nr:divalent metal cation transporter [Deltaproteobacteria bacterium]
VRRLVTMSPAFVVIAIGYNATQCLVLSQVVLSIVLPLPMIALVMFTRRADVMGEFANSRITNLAACASIAIVLALNLVLLFEAWSA